MNNAIEIVAATVDDIPTIRAIAMATWPECYHAILSAGQIEYMLHNMYSPTTLQQQLLAGEQAFLLAYQNNNPIAFAGFGMVQHAPIIYKLHKLYVLPTAQRSGAGNELLQAVITGSRLAGATQLILNVNRSNNATKFYLRNGFKVLEEQEIAIGNGFLMVDYVMGKLL